MQKRAVASLLGAALLAGTALGASEPVNAQIPAFLPNKDAVPATDPMAIDGDWRVNTIGKVIRIDSGRAYAVDGWTHALVLQVQPDMVTIQNIQQTGDTEYVGDDLPLMGKVTLRHVAPDRIEASVPGLFGPIRYTLTRVAGGGAATEAPPPMFATGGDPAGSREDTGSDIRPLPAPRFNSLGEAFGEPRPLPETFRGCRIPESARTDLSAPTQSETPRDRITGRQFAPVADENATADPEDSCWTRLDGVWSENRRPVFDTSQNDGKEWDVVGLDIAGLLHGNYTTPETLFVAPGDDPENEIWVMSGTNDVRYWRYTSSDGQSIAQVIAQPGLSKTFDAVDGSPYGASLVLDYTAGGELRFRIGGRQFLRPESSATSDVAIDDVFAIDKQTDNFAANLRGYNVLTQNPFILTNNNLGEVFARRGQDEYRFQEKYAVPFGFTLSNEVIQGSVYRQTLAASEREMQSTFATGFGAKATVSASGAVNSVLAFIPGTGTIADTGYSVGFQNTNETMNAMRQSNSIGQVVGYSRAKSYAIVLDHANSKLSGDFLTAVTDAQRDGDYRYLISRFGTHYPYAVTYGSSAKMWKEISTEAYSSALSKSEGSRVEAEVQVVGSGINGFDESRSEVRDSNGGQLSNDNGRFIAVGGNGSFDSGGFSRGDRLAPILLDLRPLDELLNPINFPDQPDIYTRVRAELGLAINGYLAGQTRPLSNERLISKVSYVQPEPEPEVEQEVEPIEEWHVYARNLRCNKTHIGTTVEVEGTIRILGTGPRSAFSREKKLKVKCEYKKKHSKTYDYQVSENEPGLLILRGTRSQMEKYNLKFEFNWSYNAKRIDGKSRQNSRDLNSTPMQRGGLPVGESNTTYWTFRNGKQPEVRLGLRVKHYADIQPEN